MALGMVLLQGPAGWRFLISEVPLYQPQPWRSWKSILAAPASAVERIQGYPAHKKHPPPLGPP